MESIQNKKIKISIKDIGAELGSIISLTNNKEYLWRGDSNFWGGQAPILFPFVGRLKEDTFYVEGKAYSQKQHGFFRRSDEINLVEKTDTKITYRHTHTNETLKVYPFQFEFTTSYELIENKIIIVHEVVNLGESTMYFSIGEHPAFNCSLHDENESYDSCSIIFEQEETDDTWNLNNDGLFDTTTTPVLNKTKSLELHKNSFDKDAMVFKNLNSNKVTLLNANEGPLITVEFKDFSYLGIWSKPNAPFVCIEPWQGYADANNSSQKLEEKEAITKLKPKEKHISSYSITIHD